MGFSRKDKEREIDNVGDVLDSLLAKFGFKARIEENKALIAWEKAVGDIVAQNSRALSISEGILVIETKDNVWMQEISLYRQSIIEKINEMLGFDAVKELRFRIGTVKRSGKREGAGNAPDKKEKPAAKPQKVSAKIESEIKAALSGIEDEELKAALRNMMIRGFKRESK